MSFEPIISASLSPYLDRWLKEQANKPSRDGITFSVVAPLRNLTISANVLMAITFAFLFWDAWNTNFHVSFMDVVILFIPIFCIGQTLVTWPVQFKFMEDGLHCNRFIKHTIITWDQIEFAVKGMDSEIILYLKDGKELGISPFILGRIQLLKLIKEKIEQQTIKKG